MWGGGWNLEDEEEEIVKRKILCASTEEKEGETKRRYESKRNLKKSFNEGVKRL